jgi:hypothetical protein
MLLLYVQYEEEVTWLNGSAFDCNIAVPGWNPAPPLLRQGPTASVPGCADTWDGTVSLDCLCERAGAQNP